jgi:electron transfer flavoprotein beta subunit
MDIVVLIKAVPDLAEELEIDSSGTDISREWMSLVASEWDEYALEEALQLKAAIDATVTCLALDTGSVDEVLATALARGADRAMKVGSFEKAPDSHVAARAYADALRGVPHDLVLTGVQAIDDLDGQVGPLLAAALDLPHVSVVTHIELVPAGAAATVHQEYSGGVVAEFEVDLPAVLGVQASREAPRYAPVSRVRQLMKTAEMPSIEVAVPPDDGGLVVESMSIPEMASQAEMVGGSPDEIADRLATLIRERGVVGGGVR